MADRLMEGERYPLRCSWKDGYSIIAFVSPILAAMVGFLCAASRAL